MRVVVGIALICLPGILICAGLLFAFDARDTWLLIAGVISWLAGGVLVADWNAVVLIGSISTATAVFVWFADPFSPGDTGVLAYYLFVAVPYATFSAVVVSAGVIAAWIGA